MTWGGRLRLAAIATLVVVAVVPLASKRPGGTVGVAAQAPGRPVADTQGDSASSTSAAATSSPETVPFTTADINATVLQLATAPDVTSTAVATTVVATTNAETRALGLLRYPWSKLGYQIAFHGPKAGFYGLTDCQTRRIDIYVAAGESVAQLAYATAFEIGHAIDCSDQVAGHRAEWPILRGFQVTGPWFPGCSCSEDSFASGDFAEVFARWQVGAAFAWRSTLAPAPTAAQMAILVPLFG